MTLFKSELSGPNAFYKKADYDAVTKRDFASQTALSPTYIWNSESKIRRVLRQTFSILFFPILGYEFLHNLVGKLVVPATSPHWVGGSKDRLNHTRQLATQDTEWKYKRLTIEVDGTKIDTVIFGKETTLDNGRWTVMTGGNGQFYEDSLVSNSELKRLLPKINSNAILFNYPGVLASEGSPNRQAMAKAHRAVLSFLENEIQAKNIIVYGHSIGGGVQGDVIKSHTLQPGVKYVFIKSRTSRL